MHIKQVIIEGFKSYKDQTIVEPFSRNINAVVGANGSGKSNFFHAIRFVLADIFTQTPVQERQKLLHEGAGHAVMSAYVEVVFDNSDSRLPVDRDEVRLRRTIGLKKDEYTLDKKHVTKTEVMNLLESAGFSRANPYYVVQQGKITSMSLIKDEERLELLKEIGGTKVYEERRRDSLKVMHETEGRRNHIEEVIEELGTKLAELEKDCEDLKEYQQIDKQRRALEFNIYDADLTDTRTQLDKLEAQRLKENERTTEAHNDRQGVHQEVKRIEKELKAQQGEVKGQEALRATAAEDKAAAMRACAKAELDLREAQQRTTSAAATQDQRQQELADVTAEIEAQQQELADVKQELQQHTEHEAALARDIADRNRRLQALYQKQGREKQFTSAAERDTYLNKELAQLQASAQGMAAVRDQVEQQAADLNSQAMDLSQSVGDKRVEVQQREEHIARCDAEQKELITKRDELQNKRKELFRSEDDTKREVRQVEDQRRGLLKLMESSMPREVARSLDNVARLVADHKVQGVHGPLIDLFECHESLYTAVEVTAGNQLFNVVVDTDTTASRIYDLLNKNKAGRITCLPINRLHLQEPCYPKDAGNDALPLVGKLNFQEEFRKPLQQVFGRTMVCRNMDVALNISRVSNLDCVTMDGDQARKKGTLSGGWLDTSRSKLTASRGLREVDVQLAEARARLEAHKGSLDDTERAITLLLGDIQKLAAKRAHLTDSLGPLRTDLRAMQKREQDVRQQLEAKEQQTAEVKESEAELQKQVDAARAELGTALNSQLSAAEKADLSRLGPEVERLQKELADTKAKRLEVEASAQELAMVLEADLTRRAAELEDALSSADVDATRASLDGLRAEVAAAQAALQEAEAAAADAAKRVEAAEQRVAQLKAEQEEKKTQEDADEQRIQDEARVTEGLLAREAALRLRRTDLERRIRDLGTLPADAYEEGLRAKSPAQLQRALKAANDRLKQCGAVNKKALDQYVNFSEQRDELARRRDESHAAEAKIQQLITALDMRKDEAIERTFKGVAKNFKEIFEALAPGGSGQLVMLKRGLPAAEPADEEGQEGAAPPASERYKGVKVKVSFGAGETMSMKQLSGGQKTLAALALIFAIQRCDPAAFYLFDEIDAALDPQYRTTVAAMLAGQAADEGQPSQFIVTTFHPQIIQQADKVYGVSHTNRISRIEVVTQEDALEFIQAVEQEHNNENTMEEG